MHWAAMTAVKFSAIIEAGAALALKYAKKRRCCQCVMPSGTMRSKSAKIVSMPTGSSGGDRGSIAAISPGAVCARTGRSSSVAKYSDPHRAARSAH